MLDFSIERNNAVAVPRAIPLCLSLYFKIILYRKNLQVPYTPAIVIQGDDVSKVVYFFTGSLKKVDQVGSLPYLST